MNAQHVSLELDDARDWKGYVLAAVLLALVLALIGWAWSSREPSSKGTKRQIANVSVLPDKPPPPPKEEPKKEPPKQDPKDEVPLTRPQVAQAPPTPGETLKMEGAAGDGPSAFAQGAVTRDYKDGATGGQAASAPKAVDRQKFAFYARGLTSKLQSEMERALGETDVPELTLKLDVWVDDNGKVSRHEIGVISKPEYKREVSAAVSKALATLRSAPPQGLPQPINLRLNVVPQGA